MAAQGSGVLEVKCVIAALIVRKLIWTVRPLATSDFADVESLEGEGRHDSERVS